MADDALAALVQVQLALKGIQTDERLPAICGLFKDRCDTTVALVNWALVFYADVHPNVDDLAKHVTLEVKPALELLVNKLSALSEWSVAAIGTVIKEVLTEKGLKMPQLAMPVRVLVMGTPQTPTVDAVLHLCGLEKVLARLKVA